MKTIKQLILLCMFGLVSIGAQAEIYSGVCASGWDVKWELNTETGVLSFTGNGEMIYFGPTPPWRRGDLSSFIRTVQISDGVTSIESNAFRDCPNLTSITIPSSVNEIGQYPFIGCFGLNSVYISDLAAWCGIKFFDGSSNPAGGGCPLYLNGKEIKDLVIPVSVTSIGAHAFRGLINLTSVTIPSSVTSIGKEAFAGCAGLTSVTIPSSVTSIGNGAFRDCTSMVSVTIPSSVASIGEETFARCTNLASVIIPSSITCIGDRAFEECTSMASVAIPSSVTSIGRYAFSRSGLTSVSIPSSVTGIGEKAFYNCISLEQVDLSEFQGTIGVMAFNGCENIKNFSLSEKNPNCYVSGTGIYSSDHLLVSHFTSADGNLVIPYPAKYYFSGEEVLTDTPLPQSIEYPYSWNVYGENGVKKNYMDVKGDHFCTAPTTIIRFPINNLLYDGNNSYLGGVVPKDIYVFECDSAEAARIYFYGAEIHVLHLPESEMMVEEYIRNQSFPDGFATSLETPENDMAGYYCSNIESIQPSVLYPQYFPEPFDDLSNDASIYIQQCKQQFDRSLMEDIKNGQIPAIVNEVTCANGKAYELKGQSMNIAKWFLEEDTIYASDINANLSAGYNFECVEVKCDASFGVPNNTYWLLKESGTTNPKREIFIHMVPNMPYRIHALFAPDTEAEEPYKCKVRFTLNTRENLESKRITFQNSEDFSFDTNQFQDIVVFESVRTQSNLGNSIIINSVPKPGDIRNGYKRRIPFVGFWVEPLEEYDLSTGIKPTWQPPYVKDDVIYNLNGQKIVAPQKGIYIQNGKKYLKK